MKRNILIGIIIVAIVILSIVFIVNQEHGEINNIKIGAILPLTGPSANHGEDAKKAILLAMEEMENNGELRGKKIQIMFEDNLSTPIGSVNAAKKFIEANEVNAIIGPISSSNVLACAPVVDKAKVLLFSPTASSPKISGVSKYVFRNSLLATPQGKRIADFCIKKFGQKNVGVLYLNDDTGKSYFNSFRQSFERLGGNIDIVEKYDKTDTDFRTQVTKFNANKIKILYVPSIPRTMGLIIKQSYELDYNPIFLGNIGIEGEDLLAIAGDLLNSNLYYTSLPIKKEFLIRYKEKYLNTPRIAAPLTYDAVNIVIHALQYSMEKDIDVIDALKQMKDYEGVTGLLNGFDKNGDAIKHPIIKTIKNGKFVILKDSDL